MKLTYSTSQPVLCKKTNQYWVTLFAYTPNQETKILNQDHAATEQAAIALGQEMLYEELSKHNWDIVEAKSFGL